MLKYRYETSVTSCVKEILYLSSNGSNHVILHGLDLSKIDDYNIELTDGSLVIIENPFIIDHSETRMFDLRVMINNDINSTIPDGYHIFVIEMLPPNHTNVVFRILLQQSASEWEDISDNYAVLGIIHIVDNKISEIYNHYMQWNRVEYNDIFSGSTVRSINGISGDVVLRTDDIPEGTTNRYYHDALVNNNPNVSLNTQMRHKHENKPILDATTASYTIEEKQKLASLESSHFKGVYSSYENLTNSITDPQPGDYAYVDAGSGNDILNYIWDPSDDTWVNSGSMSPTPSQIKQLYESNPDTNAFTDADKTGLETHLVDHNNPHQVTAEQIGATNILNELKTVDGSGSGLDADKVDGFHASQTKSPYSIVVSDSDGKIDNWIEIIDGGTVI